jgi:hypothetical protein
MRTFSIDTLGRSDLRAQGKHRGTAVRDVGRGGIQRGAARRGVILLCGLAQDEQGRHGGSERSGPEAGKDFRDAAPLWLTEIADLAERLGDVNLLDGEGRVLEHAFEGWFSDAKRRQEKNRERWAKYNAKRTAAIDGKLSGDDAVTAQSDDVNRAVGDATPRGDDVVSSRAPTVPTVPSGSTGPSVPPVLGARGAPRAIRSTGRANGSATNGGAQYDAVMQRDEDEDPAPRRPTPPPLPPDNRQRCKRCGEPIEKNAGAAEPDGGFAHLECPSTRSNGGGANAGSFGPVDEAPRPNPKQRRQAEKRELRKDLGKVLAEAVRRHRDDEEPGSFAAEGPAA